MTADPVVGVLGGTFDPVHLGHLTIARLVRERTGLDRVLFLPAAIPPHKDGARLAPAEHRAAMVRLAIEGQPGLELCDLELRTGGTCYTIDTLRSLRREGFGTPVFLLGWDALRELPTWRSHAALVAEFDMIAVEREGASSAGPCRDPAVAQALRDLPLGAAGREAWRRASPGVGGRIFRLRTAPIRISSRDIRARVARGDPLTRLVPDAVARYIEANRLYRQEGDR